MERNASAKNRYDEEYEILFDSTKNLIERLFSASEATRFQNRLTGNPFKMVLGNQVVNAYKEHLQNCITHLKIYRQRIEEGTDSSAQVQKKASMTPFVSMIFDKADDEINNYVKGILNALRINFITGERYSKDSIPDKVKTRILDSDLFIIILVKRDAIEGGGFAAPAWLLNELGIARGGKKDLIAWVETGIKDIAGLNYEKEVMYFDRGDLEIMKKATIKFLEALKEHDLV